MHRRYLRITKYSVLEVRIYLDNPALSSWLEHVLPKIIAAIRPYVLPKLREENERLNPKNKGKKKRGVKDVVRQDEFEVAIFLTEGNRHALLRRQKVFKDKKPLRSNSNKLLGDIAEAPINVEDNAIDPVIPAEDEEENVLANLPEAKSSEDDSIPPLKRGRQDSDSLFVDDDEDDPLPKKTRLAQDNPAEDDKKKMALETTYEGFSIYGKALCLVVKKMDTKNKDKPKPAGQAMMEDWITSTQMPHAEID